MLILLVAACGVVKVPAVLLEKFNQVAIFQSVTSTSLCSEMAKPVKLLKEFGYDEKLEPQPQLLVELGLMKLKPWRIRVSSKSRTMPVR
jgi:hypothetical protein